MEATMTDAMNKPQSERSPEEWGRVAVRRPGWRWMPGMLRQDGCRYLGHGRWVHPGAFGLRLSLMDQWPDLDDPATAGCLLALLGPLGQVMDALSAQDRMDLWSALMYALMHDPSALGRACIAAAEAMGRWPGGEG